MGLYAVLWGKYKEYKEKETEITMPEPIKTCGENGHVVTVIDDIEANTQNNKKQAVVVTVPIPQQSMKAIEAQKV